MCIILNVFITGASRGIGKAIALVFAREYPYLECTILITYNKNREKALKVKEEIEELRAECVVQQLDVSDRARVKKVINAFALNYGGFDVVINNAGITKDRTLKKMSDEEWDRVIDVNLTGIFNVTRAVVPYMTEGGCIINITSVVGIMGAFGQTNYAASKAGVIAFSKSVAKELARKKIRVNCIAAGFVKTDMTAKIPEKYRRQIEERILLKRFAEPDEIAKFVYWLATDGTYCTNQVYIVDGGLSP